MMVFTPKTEVKSSSTRETERSGSFYFHGCRRTTNCKCDICLDSISATRDLLPSRSGNLQKQLSVAKTPETKNMTTPVVCKASPPLRSTPTSMPKENKEVEERTRKRRRKGIRFGRAMRVVVVFFAILTVDFAVPVTVARLSGGPKMSAEVVRKVGEELDLKVVDFRGSLRLLEEKLGHVSGQKIVNNCSSNEKSWVLDKDGPLLHMKCILHKNMVEEVSIWGFPVPTSGLLLTTTGLSPRSFTVISGKINQWSGSRLQFNGRRRGESWTSSSGSGSGSGSGSSNGSPVELTGNTWILEYSRSPLMEYSRIIPLVKDFLTSRASHVVNEILQFNWLLQSSSGRRYYHFLPKSEYGDSRSRSMPPT